MFFPFHYSQFTFLLNNTFQEKYICEENLDSKIEHEDNKLSKLRREEFNFGNIDEKYYLGILQNVNYPNLEFLVSDDRLDEVRDNINSYKVKAIFPNLKGEKDKIIRLSDTILKLESNDKLPNDNAKKFLFDSSKAKAIKDIEYLLNKNSQEWKDFDKNVFSLRILFLLLQSSRQIFSIVCYPSVTWYSFLKDALFLETDTAAQLSFVHFP